jgi:hypothetical protein
VEVLLLAVVQLDTLGRCVPPRRVLVCRVQTVALAQSMAAPSCARVHPVILDRLAPLRRALDLLA